jgi:hypothetical protein
MEKPDLNPISDDTIMSSEIGLNGLWRSHAFGIIKVQTIVFDIKIY